MKGKLVVIESGTDGSGKTTQFRMLYKTLKEEGINPLQIDFPDYENPSSILVRMYLRGELGEDPRKVNPYAVSTFYAADRFVSFQREWRQEYFQGRFILADRYTTSNFIHQASKFKKEREKDDFLNWLWDLEFNKFELPEPDLVIFLDVPPRYSTKILQEKEDKDIHELNLDYLRETYQNGCWLAERLDWKRINCIKGERLRSVADIHQEVYSVVSKFCNIKKL
ncbi:MAG TPA: thymidylate kinase [Halanaerobiales bacterium]|nr:thymidylate kinase [Halanaerobiales bacterium]